MEVLLAALPHLAVMALLLALSALFSGSETALFALARREVKQLKESGGRLGRLVADMLDRPREILTAILIGNMVVNVAYFSVAYFLAEEIARAHGRAWALLVSFGALMTVIVFGEVTPKNVAILAPAAFARLVALPMAFLLRITTPLRWVADAVVDRLSAAPQGPVAPAHITAEELRLLVELGGKRGLIEGAENELIQEVMELGEIPVREVMVPRVDMVVYEAGRGPGNGGEALAEAAGRARSRVVPVSDGSLDHILGVIDVKDAWLAPERPARELVQPVSAVPANKRLDAVLRLLWEEGSLAALVVDQHGGTEGFVTMDRILDELAGSRALVGDPIRPIEEGRYLLSGRLAIRDWIALFPVDALSPRWETLGGFVTFLLGRHPREGDTATFGNLRFTVKKLVKLRVEEVLVELKDGEAAP